MDDRSATLNQTNVGANNNKFYKVQLLTDTKQKFHVWIRWGRVGEVGKSKLLDFQTEALAAKEFEKRFRLKTGNKWANRAAFVPKDGCYDIVETEAVLCLSTLCVHNNYIYIQR